MDPRSADPDFYKNGYCVSTDKSRLDRDMIHSFLQKAYWSREIPRPVVEEGIRNALCFGVYDRDRQIGFARVISDCATFAYLADVFILEDYRGRGLGKWMIECIMSHPRLQGMRRWILATRDAHGLYGKYGFRPLKDPGRFMEIVHPEI